jgi:predicted hydrolase (HD superfamily)
MATLEAGISKEQALELLHQYNKDEFHIEHGETVARLMRYFAEQRDPENADFWELVGLLHDLDWEMFDPDLHTIETARILAEAGATPELAKSIQTHQADLNKDLPAPELEMEKVLYACDELSGLIGACVAMRPSKSVMDFTVKSLKKKYKTKNFAAGCSREDIAAAAEMNGLELDELFAMMIEAMQATAPDRDTFQA